MKFRKLIVFIALFGLIVGLAGPYLIRSYNPWWSSGAKQYKNLPGYYNQKLNWRGCFGEFECANLSVPVDYANLRKPAINIAVIKLPAKSKKLGSLVVNPGGPGASGVDYVYGKKADKKYYEDSSAITKRYFGKYSNDFLNTAFGELIFEESPIKAFTSVGLLYFSSVIT